MSRLVSMFMLWLLLLLAAAPASAVMDVQPRNCTWELPASSYDLAPDVRDGPNLYAYVKQNPWTSFDPDGLAETAVTKAIKERSQLVVQAYESAGSEDGAAAQKAQFTRGQAVAGAMAKGLNEVVTNTPIGAANEALTGKNASGEPLSAVERLAVMAGFIPAGKFAGRLGKAGVDALSASAQEISKKADEIVDAIRKGGDGAAKGGAEGLPSMKGMGSTERGKVLTEGGSRRPMLATARPRTRRGHIRTGQKFAFTHTATSNRRHTSQETTPTCTSRMQRAISWTMQATSAPIQTPPTLDYPIPKTFHKSEDAHTVLDLWHSNSQHHPVMQLHCILKRLQKS